MKRFFCLFLCVFYLVHVTLSADDVPQSSSAATVEHPALTMLLEPVDDPLQGFNRAMESVNSFLVRRIVHPISIVYNRIVPEFISTSIKNFSHNLLFPLRLVTNCLQGKFAYAWEETERFCINTTVGILGFRDPATKWEFQRHDEDFGQTLAVWGVGPGCYVNLPALGPSNVRDAITKIPDMFLNPATYFTGASLALGGNSLFCNAAFLDNYFKSRHVTYPLSKAIFMMSREALIRDGVFPPVTSMPDESLGIMKMIPKDRLFYSTAYERSVTLPGATKPLEYSLFRQHVFNGKIMFVLPGLSSTRNNTDIVAMAEIFHKDGWTVAIISSTFTPDFFLCTDSPLPGNLPHDCRNLDIALTTIRDDIMEYEKKSAMKNSKGIPAYPSSATCQVFGVSLGAINTLYLAALDDRGESRLGAERFIAVNPPRTPLTALKKLDACFDIPLSWPEETRKQKTNDAIQRIAYTVMEPESARNIALDHDESLFIIGLNCRLGIVELCKALSETEHRHLIEHVIRMDSDEHLEHDAFALSYEQYLRDILLYHAKRLKIVPQDMTIEKFADNNTIDSQAEHLRTNPKVRFFHNQNDFLLEDGDIAWYQSVFAGRCFIFPAGSHLGNLFIPEVQAALLQASR